MLTFYFKKYKMYVAIAAQSVALSLCSSHSNRFNRYRRFFTRMIVNSVGAKIKLTGNIDKDTDILIVNHQSMFDIFSLEQVIGNDIRFIGRTGIMDKWPVSKIVNMVGHITVNQQDSRAIIKLLKDVKVCKGKKVIIFPEGTRSQTGKIEPFEAGAKLLVEKLKLKAQPVVIKNILDIYNESNKTATSGAIEIEALPAITITENWYTSTHQAMSKTLKQ
jgi:1-acyl-sn-glycerol-3-phosphate acyltransferase